MKPKRKERRRSSRLELLGGVEANALRRMRDIAYRADLPVERVFKDVITIGVSVIGDPLSSPYQSLIGFRQELARKELENVEQEAIDAGQPRGGGRETFSEPGLSDEADQGLMAERDSLSEENAGDGSDNAVERSGLVPEVGADSFGDGKPEV